MSKMNRWIELNMCKITIPHLYCVRLSTLNIFEMALHCKNILGARTYGSDDPRVTRQSQSLRWRHNEHDGVSNHQPHDCLLNRLCRRRSKKTSKLRVTGLCVGNSPVTGEFPAQMASNAENVSIWWRHHSIVIQDHREAVYHWQIWTMDQIGSSTFKGSRLGCRKSMLSYIFS